MIIREREPLNLEMPFAELGGSLTPNGRFYVRALFPIPQPDMKTWRLKIEGAVARPFELSYDELRQKETRTLTATLECAGNSRVFLVPQAEGAQWGLGAVGNVDCSELAE